MRTTPTILILALSLTACGGPAAGAELSPTAPSTTPGPSATATPFLVAEAAAVAPQIPAATATPSPAPTATPVEACAVTLRVFLRDRPSVNKSGIYKPEVPPGGLLKLVAVHHGAEGVWYLALREETGQYGWVAREVLDPNCLALLPTLPPPATVPPAWTDTPTPTATATPTRTPTHTPTATASPTVVVPSPSAPGYYLDLPVFVVPGGGGSGGSENGLTCPVGYVATGLFGRAGRFIDELGVLCREFYPSFTTGALRRTLAYGGTGGSPFSMECGTANYVLVGVSGAVGRYVDHLSLVCRDSAGNTFTTGGAGGPDGQPMLSVCPSGSAMIGLTVRWGDFVDQINVVCMKIKYR